MSHKSARSPEKECDLVMKGGITSGVVYPPVVFEMKDTYRFRSIGGTSAGAIAAALTAAAEYGREECNGFEAFEEAQGQLNSPGFLRGLFQPSEVTRPLMEVLLALMKTRHGEAQEQEGFGLVRALQLFRILGDVLNDKSPVAFRRGRTGGRALGAVLGVLVGAILGGLLYLLSLLVAAVADSPLVAWLPVLSVLVVGSVLLLGVPLAWLFGWLAGPAWAAYDLLRVLTEKMPEENYYGLCTGRTVSDLEDQKGLTDWLSEKINEFSGKSACDPLTFGDLASKTIPGTGNGDTDVGIALRMVTTNLSQGEPYVFPRENNTLLFHEEEMAAFFPEGIVDCMKRTAHQSTRLSLPPKYHFLPTGDKLPIVVATRLSLSFPVLLSAVPLYTIDDKAFRGWSGETPIELDVGHLRRNWFSDGGICINFPIHFYDAWLPTRPTFGINLTSFKDQEAVIRSAERPEEYEGESLSSDNVDLRTDTDAAERIFLPRANEPENPEWTELGGVGQFASAILSSAMNFRDNMQARLPSYRERIVQVRLREDEGGLNLEMPPATIDFLGNMGAAAGECLREDFEFDHHGWVRLRILLEQLETHLKTMFPQAQPDAEPLWTAECIQELIERQHLENYPYNISNTQWRAAAPEIVEHLREFIATWPSPADNGQARSGSGDLNFFRPMSHAEPEPELRISPKV